MVPKLLLFLLTGNGHTKSGYWCGDPRHWLCLYVSGVWLEQFADSTLPSPVWFVLLAVGLLVLIVLLVILKAWRIANENPVQSIKSE